MTLTKRCCVVPSPTGLSPGTTPPPMVRHVSVVGSPLGSPLMPSSPSLNGPSGSHPVSGSHHNLTTTTTTTTTGTNGAIISATGTWNLTPRSGGLTIDVSAPIHSRQHGHATQQSTRHVRRRAQVTVTAINDTHVLVISKVRLLHCFPSAVAWKQFYDASLIRLSLTKHGSERTPLDIHSIHEHIGATLLRSSSGTKLMATQTVRERICSSLIYERYGNGDVIYQQGELANSFYIVHSGSVNLFVTASRKMSMPLGSTLGSPVPGSPDSVTGRRSPATTPGHSRHSSSDLNHSHGNDSLKRVVTSIGVGGSFGEIELIDRHMFRQTTAEVASPDTIVLKLMRDDYTRIYGQFHVQEKNEKKLVLSHCSIFKRFVSLDDDDNDNMPYKLPDSPQKPPLIGIARPPLHRAQTRHPNDNVGQTDSSNSPSPSPRETHSLVTITPASSTSVTSIPVSPVSPLVSLSASSLRVTTNTLTPLASPIPSAGMASLGINGGVTTVTPSPASVQRSRARRVSFFGAPAPSDDDTVEKKQVISTSVGVVPSKSPSPPPLPPRVTITITSNHNDTKESSPNGSPKLDSFGRRRGATVSSSDGWNTVAATHNELPNTERRTNNSNHKDSSPDGSPRVRQRPRHMRADSLAPFMFMPSTNKQIKNAFFQSFQKRSYERAGSVLLRAGDIADCLYVIINGEVRVERDVEYVVSGEITRATYHKPLKPLVIALIPPGDYFGEQCLLSTTTTSQTPMPSGIGDVRRSAVSFVTNCVDTSVYIVRRADMLRCFPKTLLSDLRATAVTRNKWRRQRLDELLSNFVGTSPGVILEKGTKVVSAAISSVEAAAASAKAEAHSTRELEKKRRQHRRDLRIRHDLQRRSIDALQTKDGQHPRGHHRQHHQQALSAANMIKKHASMRSARTRLPAPILQRIQQFVTQRHNSRMTRNVEHLLATHHKNSKQGMKEEAEHAEAQDYADYLTAALIASEIGDQRPPSAKREKSMVPRAISKAITNMNNANTSNDNNNNNDNNRSSTPAVASDRRPRSAVASPSSTRRRLSSPSTGGVTSTHATPPVSNSSRNSTTAARRSSVSSVASTSNNATITSTSSTAPSSVARSMSPSNTTSSTASSSSSSSSLSFSWSSSQSSSSVGQSVAIGANTRRPSTAAGRLLSKVYIPPYATSHWPELVLGVSTHGAGIPAVPLSPSSTLSTTVAASTSTSSSDMSVACNERSISPRPGSSLDYNYHLRPHPPPGTSVPVSPRNTPFASSLPSSPRASLTASPLLTPAASGNAPARSASPCTPRAGGSSQSPSLLPPQRIPSPLPNQSSSPPVILSGATPMITDGSGRAAALSARLQRTHIPTTAERHHLYSHVPPRHSALLAGAGVVAALTTNARLGQLHRAEEKAAADATKAAQVAHRKAQALLAGLPQVAIQAQAIAQNQLQQAIGHDSNDSNRGSHIDEKSVAVPNTLTSAERHLRRLSIAIVPSLNVEHQSLVLRPDIDAPSATSITMNTNSNMNGRARHNISTLVAATPSLPTSTSLNIEVHQLRPATPLRTPTLPVPPCDRLPTSISPRQQRLTNTGVSLAFAPGSPRDIDSALSMSDRTPIAATSTGSPMFTFDIHTTSHADTNIDIRPHTAPTETRVPVSSISRFRRSKRASIDSIGNGSASTGISPSSQSTTTPRSITAANVIAAVEAFSASPSSSHYHPRRNEHHHNNARSSSSLSYRSATDRIIAADYDDDVAEQRALSRLSLFNEQRRSSLRSSHVAVPPPSRASTSKRHDDHEIWYTPAELTPSLLTSSSGATTASVNDDALARRTNRPDTAASAPTRSSTPTISSSLLLGPTHGRLLSSLLGEPSAGELADGARRVSIATAKRQTAKSPATGALLRHLPLPSQYLPTHHNNTIATLDDDGIDEDMDEDSFYDADALAAIAAAEAKATLPSAQHLLTSDLNYHRVKQLSNIST
jgi:CRP-like cAMP-binding protein